MPIRFKAARAGMGGSSTALHRPGKKLKTGFQKGASADNPDRRKDKGQTHLRSRATANRIAMYKQAPRRDRKGNILAGKFMMETQAGGKSIGAVARIQPDRRWFGNTRVVGQRELDEFRSELAAHVADPYSVVLKRKKLPMGLLADASKTARMNLLTAESYESTFGAKSQRKRPKVRVYIFFIESMTEYFTNVMLLMILFIARCRESRPDGCTRGEVLHGVRGEGR